MSAIRLVGAMIAAASVLAAAAIADEASIREQAAEANAALRDGRLDQATAMMATAWRAAEDELGDDPLTSQIASNLAFMRLMAGDLEDAVEPARRAAALADRGVVGEVVSRESAHLMLALADHEPRRVRATNIRALEDLIDAYAQAADDPEPSLLARGWQQVAALWIERERFSDAYAAARRASDLLYENPESAPPALHALVADTGANAALRSREDAEDRIEAGLIMVYRGMAAQPPFPSEEPMPHALGRLMRWEVILQRRYAREHDEEFAPRETFLYPPAWRLARYPNAMGCAVQWIERPLPRYPRSWREPAVVFEYHLDVDGSVARVEGVGDFTDEEGFTDAIAAAIRTWRAAPPARQECQGPWPLVIQFEFAN